jgi:hypothetical protein
MGGWQVQVLRGKPEALDRGEGLETHAYAFIHTDDIKTRIAELFGGDMQFDVIIGNPPYQLDDGGFGTSAAPIYQLFVSKRKRSNRAICRWSFPARWFAGGKGLDEFRESMLTDDRLRSIDDYLSASDVFPGVGLKGGVCYFLWDRDNPGTCQVTTHFKDGHPQQRAASSSKRVWTCSSASMKGCRSSRRLLPSRVGERNHCRCLKPSVSTDWLAQESRSV